MTRALPGEQDILAAIGRYARYSLGRRVEELSRRELYLATSLAVREVVIDRMLASEQTARAAGAKRIYYLSMEFLLGRALSNNLLNLGLHDTCARALESLGADLDEVREQEPDPALGNGGLGRLAACFLDSMATLGLPGYGYGINYEFGLFRQVFNEGRQEERPDEWRSPGSPWLILRPEAAHKIPLYGEVVERRGDRGRRWVPGKITIGTPSDMPIVGWGGRTVNYLRLYAARASDEFDMSIFNAGDYVKAVDQKIRSESISKILYPADDHPAGRELRLVQEYFFVACSLRDILARHARNRQALADLPAYAAIQLNDTHPALAIAEMMRLLVDEKHVEWAEAWRITASTFAFTNHTLLPEALETWPLALLERVLPRHVEIIRRIDDELMEEVEARWPGDEERKGRMAIIGRHGDHPVRMAHLAIAGSHSVNGVSRLHGSLIRTSLVPDFHALWPERFNSKTNGVTQRRWLLKANPPLAQLLTRLIGEGWISDLERLRGLEEHADDPQVLAELNAIKRAHKESLAGFVRRQGGPVLDPASLFDSHAKRIHEYKRQLMNALRIVHDYVRLVDHDDPPAIPRTYLFAGKSAPGYATAKRIIEFVNAIARTVNQDPKAQDWMRVVFLADYRVSLAERIIPATDVSEQISTAGMEASGTGNMKFMMNGALTAGTLDGANIEMADEAGEENLFIFGLTADQVGAHRREGTYHARAVVEADERVRRVVDAVSSERFGGSRASHLSGLVKDLLDRDPYFVLADLGAFLDVQERIADAWLDRGPDGGVDPWARKCLLNVARSGRFSSDRAILEYAREIWRVKPPAAAAAHEAVGSRS